MPKLLHQPLSPSYLQSFLLLTHLTSIYEHLLCARFKVLKINLIKTQLSISHSSAYINSKL